MGISQVNHKFLAFNYIFVCMFVSSVSLRARRVEPKFMQLHMILSLIYKLVSLTPQELLSVSRRDIAGQNILVSNVQYNEYHR